MKHQKTIGDRFRALIAYDPLSGLRKKHRKEGGRVSLASHIDEQAKVVDTKPTDGQKEAGNYRKGHVKVHGLDISIENPRGSWREGGPPDKRWRSKLPHHYGYIRKTEGGDGDHVDCYIGPHLRSPNVFVIDQHHLDGEQAFDEHKCFIGFGSKPQAREAYHRAFSDGKGKDRIGHVETMTVDEFKDWLKNSDTTAPVKHRADGGRVHMVGGGVPSFDDTQPVASGPPPFEATQPVEQPEDMGGAKAALHGAAQGATFGFADELAGAHAAGPEWLPEYLPGVLGARTMVGAGRTALGYLTGRDPDAVASYEKARDEEREANELAQKQHPYLHAAGEIAGSIPAMAVLPEAEIGAGLTGVGKAAAKIVQGAITGGEYGAISGVGGGTDAESRITGGLEGTASGIAGGAVGAGAGHAISEAVASDIARIRAIRADRQRNLPIPDSSGNDVVSAADRISKISPVEVPKAFASDNIAVQRAGQLARNVPIVGDSIPRATGRMVDQLGDANAVIASHYGEGSGPNVASRIGNNIDAAAENETSAATNAARRSDDALLADWQRSQDEALHQVGHSETSAFERARQATGDMSPQDMGQALIERLRTGEQAARARKDQLYNAAGNSDASVRSESVQGVHNRVSTALDDRGRVVDPQLTPAANSMMNELQRFSNLEIPNRVGPRPPDPADIVSVDARGMEQTRKRLSGLSQAANNDADRAAARIIMHEFDAWQGDAYERALFSGSPEALQSFRDARSANASWRQRFYNDRDDADRLINRVVTGEVTPQEMSNWLVGNTQVGSKGISSRLLTRLGEVTDNDPQALNAIRGGVANRLFGTTEGATARGAEKTASDIYQFFNGSGRDVANRLFTPQQRQSALNYANTLRRGENSRQDIASVSANTKPSAMKANPGPMQQLARATLGASGKTDEALFSAIDSYAKSGSRGDVQTLSDIVRNIPEKDRGDLAGAIIRKLGYSDQAKGFSPEKFATDWAKYTPQAKSILFGNAGAHRQALDDIATIAQRYKEVGRRFGNPSGTGQQVTGFGSIAAVFTHPFIAIPSLVGGTVFARMLSAPASAQKTANLFKKSLAMADRPNQTHLNSLTSAAESFAKEAQNSGSKISVPQFMKQLRLAPVAASRLYVSPMQGPVPARAGNEQQKTNGP